MMEEDRRRNRWHSVLGALIVFMGLQCLIELNCIRYTVAAVATNPNARGKFLDKITGHSFDFIDNGINAIAEQFSEHLPWLKISKTEIINKMPMQPRSTRRALANGQTLQLPKLNQKRQIVLIHVGKAGGTTIRSILPKAMCYKAQQHAVDQKCVDKATKAQSAIGKLVFAQVHIVSGQNVNAFRLNTTTSMLFSIRNPIRRTFSAYNFLHPNSTMSALAPNYFPEKWFFYFDCYPNLESWLGGIDEAFEAIETSIENDEEPKLTECQKFGLRILQGGDTGAFRVNQHLAMNHAWYVEHSTHMYPSIEVFAIRTEHLWEDVQNLDVLLGGAGDFPSAGKVVRKSPKLKENVTQTQYHRLCCVLHREIGSYQHVLDRSLNLAESAKAEAIEDTMNTCGIDKKTSRSFQEDRSYGINWFDWHKHKCTDVSPYLGETRAIDEIKRLKDAGIVAVDPKDKNLKKLATLDHRSIAP